MAAAANSHSSEKVMAPERAVVPIVLASEKHPIEKVLGSGFFVGDDDNLFVVTARHVVDNGLEKASQGFGIVLKGSEKIAVVACDEIRGSLDFDIAAMKFTIDTYFDEAYRLPIATSDPGLNDDVFSFEYSSSRIERNAEGGLHVSIEPYAHKGNIVRMYESTFPESRPTPAMLTSFPALQGASGAPLLVKTTPRRTLAVVGMLVANFERHLMPAQVVRIDNGEGEREEIRYYLPYGKALARRKLADELRSMGVPFESAQIMEAEEGGEQSKDEHST